MRNALMALLPALAPFLCGCPVWQNQHTPVDEFRRQNTAGQEYWVYVPSYYSPDRAWPLVVTLHGTHGFDSAGAQIREWKSLAEECGLIVAAPELRSPQGILPVMQGARLRDLQRDEQTILACMRDLRKAYTIEPRAVLMTGFSAGGYAMYYVGLRHPEEFSALAARACNSETDIFESFQPTDQARRMPIIIIHGKDDLGPIGQQSWAAFRWLREHRFTLAEHHKIEGGHIRQPEMAWRCWKPFLPPEYRHEEAK